MFQRIKNRTFITENGNDSGIAEPESGYDLPVYGLDNGSFYYIHIPAILCIFASLTCAIITVALSFRRQHYRTFFTQWSKSERFIIYLALCDGSFNIAHITDHMHTAIVRGHVLPKELCEFYGFIVAVSGTSQSLVVTIIAVNAFMMIYFDKKLHFGYRDWRLLTLTFGGPFVEALIAGILGQLGPNGTFCFFDSVKGKIANTIFTTVPLLVVFLVNTILYILTWKRVRDQTEAIRHTMTSMPTSMRASHRAARAMSMFVAAFLIQWWAVGLYGVWGLIDENVPQALFHLVTTFTNIGGCLNLVVYLLIKRKQIDK